LVRNFPGKWIAKLLYVFLEISLFSMTASARSVGNTSRFVNTGSIAPIASKRVFKYVSLCSVWVFREMTAIIATLGFDERHIVRSILRIGFGGVKRILLLVPRGGVEDKTMKAFEQIKSLASIAGVDDVSMVEVPIEMFNDAVAEIRKIAYECVSKYNRVFVSLGGGMRALVIETLIAIFTLPPSEKRKIEIVVDLESGKDSIRFPAWIPLELRLSDVESRVLEYVVSKGSANLADVATELDIARSTAWKALERLVDAGFLTKREFVYEPTDVGKFVYSLITKGIPREASG